MSQFARQLIHFFALMLWAAAGLAVVGGHAGRLAQAGARCGTGYVYESDAEWRAHGDPHGRRTGSRVPPSAAEAETNLRLYGLVALQDPPSEDVGEAIRTCRQAGVAVSMITGDHPATAAAIAAQV